MNLGTLPVASHAARRYQIAHYPVALIDRVRLADARSVTVRPVLPQDADALQAFVQRLSLASRRRRFHMGVRALPDEVLRAFTQLDYANHLGLLAEVFDDAQGQTIVADARFVQRPGEPVADLAIVVADDWQGIGLGNYLIAQLLHSARASGLAAVEADVIAENQPMLRMLARFGFRLGTRTGEPGMVHARLAFRPE